MAMLAAVLAIVPGVTDIGSACASVCLCSWKVGVLARAVLIVLLLPAGYAGKVVY